MNKFIVFLVVIATTASASFALNLETCNASLGLESGHIKDAAITASSSYDASNVGPQFARLNQDKNGGAWCPKQQVMRGVKEWLEIDLKTMHVISTVQTQGRFGNGQGQEYVEQFKLEYWRPGMERWMRYRNQTGAEIFTGNTNTYMVANNYLNPVILATKIKFVPYSIHRRTVCLRIELSGCKFEEGVVSYSGPQGDVFRNSDLIDETYDGIVENGFLKGGLGQLLDGRVGQNNVENVSKGYGWVGWQNKTNAPRLGLLELTFEFEGVRNFSRIDVFVNNDYHKHIQVFSVLRVLFSIGGRQFPLDSAVTYFYMPDHFLDNARNVSINLGFKMARYLKLQFTFAAEWLVVSEFYFTSEQAVGNFSDDVRDRGRQKDEGFLQRDAVAQIKTSDIEEDFSTQSYSSHTGIVIGVMTSIIIALAIALAVVIGKSVHNVEKSVEQSILQTSFGRMSPQNLGLEIQRNSADYDFGTTNSASYEKTIYSPIDERNLMNLGRKNASIENSSTFYNEPFSDDDSCSPRLNVKTKKQADDRTESIALGEQDYDVIPAYPYETEKTSPMIGSPTTNVSFMSRLYSHMNYSRIEAQQHPSTPPSQLTRSGSILSNDKEGFYATTELFQQSTGTTELREMCSTKLNRINHLSCGQFGDNLYLCQLTEDSMSTTVVLSRQFPSYWKNDEMDKEIQTQCKLQHDKILPFLGLVLPQQPENRFSIIFGYGDVTDMYQFLQNHVAETSSLSERSLSYGCLIFMAKQIAAAMEYLEIHNIIHRDLAARNCLVDSNYGVKIACFDISSKLYPGDYFMMDDGRYLPLRWMAWESVTLEKFSSSSDAWSFGVLLWEMLTFARDPPIEALTDNEVLRLLTHYQQQGGLNEILLSWPILCPKDIYDLMCECWKCNPNDRPTFKEIHMFLMRKNLGYRHRIK
ncbi:discoidin domain-containing receptor 2-like [Daphnia pulicaria]|uniref:discoidin domain-containing receptor 2-like n=1 Tax=Daphnia pulicaria TaxID=35523 RepID=UPI001EEBC425|nr:discoidin domain-containing receptor 2-like [Daphnia pulicaria]